MKIADATPASTMPTTQRITPAKVRNQLREDGARGSEEGSEGIVVHVASQRRDRRNYRNQTYMGLFFRAGPHVIRSRYEPHPVAFEYGSFPRRVLATVDPG